MKLPRPLALDHVLHALRARDYHFITPTPTTHARVTARKERAEDLRDVFGWSLPFRAADIDADILACMEAGEVLRREGDVLFSTVRASSLGPLLLLHSAFPTDAPDAVFFGPDSYRFAAFLDAELPALGTRAHVVDVGAGSGVGALTAAPFFPGADVTLVDINREALALARANTLHAATSFVIQGGESWRFVQGAGLDSIDAPIDLVIANPPFLADHAQRAYRDGGGALGAGLSVAWARQAAAKLTPGGALVMYSGSAIVNGEDRLEAALRAALGDFDIVYRELDPDIFGEELARDVYRDVERIAAIGIVAVMR